jgi:hypothetical protein
LAEVAAQRSQRDHQSELFEQDRVQLTTNPVHIPIHLPDPVPHRADPSRGLRTRAALLDLGKMDFKQRQPLPEIVVQFLRDPEPVLLQHFNQVSMRRSLVRSIWKRRPPFTENVSRS